MFFEGCAAHLGCSIKLRGAADYELARVKEIIMLMVCVAYHSQLEISFLMDEFAMPPSMAQSTTFPCLLEVATVAEEGEMHGGRETNGDGQDKSGGSEVSAQTEEEGVSSESADLKDKHTSKSPPAAHEEEAPAEEMMTPSPFSGAPNPPLAVSPPFLMEEDEELDSSTLIAESEGETGEEGSLVKGESFNTEDAEEPPTPRLFRDPLQDDTGMFVAEQVASTDDHLKSISAVFKQELKDIILCISPFITFKKPFLLTPAGMHCPSREYFPEQVHGFAKDSFQG